MPDTPDIPAPRRFEQLLGQLDADPQTLPDLVPRPSFYETWIAPWVKKAQDWIASFFPEAKESTFLRDLLQLVVAALPYLLAALAAVAVAALLLLLGRALLRYVRSVETVAPPEAAPLPLEALVADALAAGDYARASRLRWKLFLARRREPPHRTPLEYAPEEPAQILRRYRLMFGETPDPKPEYRELHEWLSGRETR